MRMFAANLNHFATHLTYGGAPQGDYVAPARPGGAFSGGAGAFSVHIDTFSVHADTFSGGRTPLISRAGAVVR